MKALVIGGAGFVGYYLIRQLLSDGWDVDATCLENEKLDMDVPTHILDVLDEEQIHTVFSEVKPDAVIHLAAQSSVGLSWEKPTLTLDVNIKGAVNVMEALRRNTKTQTRLLLVGSGEQYGAVKPRECPVKETHKMSPGNIYAATKASQDMLGEIYSKAFGLNIVRVRAFNHFGPRQSPHFVVSDFCRQIALIERGLTEPILRVGNLLAARDFCDVRDIVCAYSELLKTGKIGEVYNVGSGKAVRIDEILKIALSFSTRRIDVIIDESKYRPIDVPLIEADISRLKEDTGWRMKYNIADSIKETLDYWRSEAG